MREASDEADDEAGDHGEEDDGDEHGEETPPGFAWAAVAAPASHSP
jgi:hypothetical protein